MYAITKNGKVIYEGFKSFIEAENYWMNNFPTWEFRESNEPFGISQFTDGENIVKVEFSNVTR